MPYTDVPKNVPAYASKEVMVHATVEEVWAVLTDLASWPQWNENVRRMEVRGPLFSGTEFQWVAGGMKIRSRIEEVNAPNRIIWSGTTMGIKAIHLWELSPVDTMTRVHTEESFQGLIVRLFAKRMKNELENTLARDLGALKNQVENRGNGTKE